MPQYKNWHKKGAVNTTSPCVCVHDTMMETAATSQTVILAADASVEEKIVADLLRDRYLAFAAQRPQIVRDEPSRGGQCLPHPANLVGYRNVTEQR